MWKYINKLKEPYLVAYIQKFFGVKCTITTDENNILPAEKNVVCINYANREDSQNAILKCEDGKHNEKNIEINEAEEPLQTECTEATCVKKSKTNNYVIENKFWYLLFMFGTYLGDELGYALFLPFLFWNIDGVVGKKIVFVWTIIMYIGQAIKDLICWPRPACPPVVRLQEKWSLEYGMPSTHAMVGVAMPTSAIFFTLDRYQYPIEVGVMIAVFFCVLISVSRLYLGMHSLLDIIVGVILCSLLLIPIIPLSDTLSDAYIMYKHSPFVIVLICIALIIIYPTGKTWTPTRGDTTIVLATFTGVEIAFWVMCNFHPHIVSTTVYSSSTTTLIWHSIGITLLRTFLGYVGLILMFGICGCMTWAVDKILGKCSIQIKDDETKRHIPLLDLSYKYVTYSINSFSVVYTIPLFFHYINIGRSNYFLEY